jgi:hypothetical protein
MDCNGVLLWGKLWGLDEARLDWRGVYLDYYTRVALGTGVSSWGQEIASRYQR